MSKKKYVNSIFFERKVVFRIKDDEIKLSKLLVRKCKGKYDNLSHFIRVAVIRLNREEKKKMKL